MSKEDLKKKREIIKRTRNMIKESAEHMTKNIERAFNSGGINLEDYEPNNVLPRIIMTALLKIEVDNYPPIYKEDKKVAENLYLLM